MKEKYSFINLMIIGKVNRYLSSFVNNWILYTSHAYIEATTLAVHAPVVSWVTHLTEINVAHITKVILTSHFVRLLHLSFVSPTKYLLYWNCIQV